MYMQLKANEATSKNEMQHIFLVMDIDSFMLAHCNCAVLRLITNKRRKEFK